MSAARVQSRQAGGRGAQELVAGGVADAVVDGLEAVEVDEEHAQLGLAAGRHVERVLEAVEEERAVGQPGQRVVEGLLHGLDGARVGQREARVLGEGVEHAELGVVEAAPDAIATSAPARAPLMWTEAASAPSALGVLAVRAAAVATMASSVSERSPPAVVAATIGRSGSSGSSRTSATGQPPSRPLAPDVIAAEHLGQRLAVRDRALDVEQDLEQAVALAQRGEQRQALARLALALGAQRALGLQRGDAAQREPEHARHAQQQVALVGAERRRRGARRAGARAGRRPSRRWPRGSVPSPGSSSVSPPSARPHQLSRRGAAAPKPVAATRASPTTTAPTSASNCSAASSAAAAVAPSARSCALTAVRNSTS